MSLLMDALKRAESSKQEAARQQGGKEAAPGADEGLTLTPLNSEPPAPVARPLPDLATHIEAVDADLARSAQTRPAVEPAPAFAQTAATGQAIARNAFAAKQAPAAARHNLLWLALGILLIVGLAIAAYVWFQLSAMGGSSLAASPPPPSRLGALPPAAPVVPVPLAASQAVAEAASPTEPEARRLPLPAEPPPLRAAATPRPAPGAAPIRLARTQPEPDPSLMRAHRQLQEGKLDLANQSFLQALQQDPNNTDALLALAAIAQHQGRTNEAEGWRQRALIADPSHPATQAAVLGRNRPADHREPPEDSSRRPAAIGRAEFHPRQSVCPSATLGRGAAGLFQCGCRRWRQPGLPVQSGGQSRPVASAPPCRPALSAGAGGRRSAAGHFRQRTGQETPGRTPALKPQ